ncbi:hypothetical protein GJAV_G00173360 [Gymnothorax javanicus]|nr:hypothetical protein GJAV_G00173360 [Gymnothorax javanicus]
MARTLLLMVLTTHVFTQAALLNKFSAVDFLSHGQREKRSMEVSAEDSEGDSDSEVEELGSDYTAGFIMQLNGGLQPEKIPSPDSEAVEVEGSGM